MGKKYKNSILTLVLALFFSFGSMKGMDLILKAREQQLLQEKGKISSEDYILKWQERDTLTMAQMEEVVKRWEKSEEWIAHNPVSGQITMEQAIREGKDWIIQMVLAVEYGIKSADIELGFVNASLGMAQREEADGAQAEPQDSFWKVEFSNHFMQGFLYVNAVTEKVWYADITLFEYLLAEMPYWKLKDFVESAGLQVSYEGAVRNKKGTEALWKIEDSRLYAKMEFAHSWALPLDGGADNKSEPHIVEPSLLKECVHIRYKFTLDRHI